MTKLSSVSLKKLIFWQRNVFLVCLFGYIGYYLCRQNLSVAFSLLEENFGYSKLQLGIIFSASEIAYAFGKIINGPLADKIGGRKIFLIGMLGSIFFNLIFTLGHSIVYFTVVWCACRYFLSMGWGGLAKMIGAWFPPEKNGTVMGWVSINFQFGGALSLLFAGFLVQQGVSWKGLFYYPAALLFLIFIWSFFSSRERPQDVVPHTSFPLNSGQSKITEKKPSSGEEDTREVSGIIKRLLAMPLFRWLLLYSFLTTFLRSVFVAWTPKILADIGLGASGGAFKSAIFPILGCVGTIGLGWYTDKYVRNGDRAKSMWIMLCGLAICQIMLYFMLGTSTPPLSLVVTLISMSGFFLLGPYSMSSGCLALDIAGAKGAGSCTGMIDFVGYIGGALSGFGAGYLADLYGWQGVFLVLSLFSVLSVLSAFMMSQSFQKRFKAQSASQ